MRLMVTMAAIAIAGTAQAQDKPKGSVAPPAMQAVAPGLAEYTDTVLFGDVWRRPDLSPRDRSLVTVAALIATGKTAQLEGHTGRALDNGVRPIEISGVVTHLAFYSGWPNAVSSIEVIDRVFRKRGIDTAAFRVPATLLPLPASDAARTRMVEETVAPTAPKLADLTNKVLFADLWRRPDLAPRDRSLVTIAALVASGDADQLAFHITHGLDNGLTQAQISEAITHLAFYVGWPRAMAAVQVARKTFASEQGAKLGQATPPVIMTPARSNPSRGPANRFTGIVTVDTSFKATGDARLGGGRVTFQPGARSNWHTHPLGQLLIVTQGRGLVQDANGPVRVMRIGDVVWTAPGVKHWHGAAPDSMLSHFAVSEAADGASVEWMDPVTDAQYRQTPVR